jgi:arabinose-5-phosphate isomerase
MNGDKILSRAKQVLETEIEGLRCLQNELGEEFVTLVGRCLDVLENGGKLVLCGIGKSGHIGHKMAATLASTGSRAVFMHPVEAMHGDLGLLQEEDVLLALSYSGETEELLSVLPSAKRLSVPIVAITGNTDSQLAQLADLTVPMMVPREACPTTTALAALGDALAIVLLECRKFGLDDYAKLHPAGAIGRSITLMVTDIMRTGDRFPRVTPQTHVRDALIEMTRARSGSVAVTDDRDRLLGIFTDGDFRRHVTRNAEVLDACIEDVMTANPITIRDTAMAIEVVKLLEEIKVDDILVVDAEKRAVGLVDIQDLPRFKVM